MTPLRGIRDENNEFLPLRSLEQAERDMAHRELKGFADAIERMEGGVSGGSGSDTATCSHRGGKRVVRPTIQPTSRLGWTTVSPSIAYILAGLVFLATWGLAVLLEEPAGKPTPPYYKTFQERLEQ